METLSFLGTLIAVLAAVAALSAFGLFALVVHLISEHHPSKDTTGGSDED